MNDFRSLPVYSIYDRDIPREHIAACVIVNPIAPVNTVRDGREEWDKTVGGCEGDRCRIKPKEITP